jgi:hypothetical protein
MRYVLPILATLSIGMPFTQTAPLKRPEAEAIVAKYVNAVGGAAAISAVISRVTRGTFDNGRGLVTPFVTWVKTPDKLATHIGPKDIGDGEGSGRATDGRIGWDKNFVGTGLRDMPANELDEAKRTADPFRPAHLAATCLTLGIDVRSDAAIPGELVRCDLADSVERWTFNSTTGLVDRLDATSRGGRTTMIIYDDYRRVDGLLTPFRERIAVPGATVTYSATTIQYNEAVPQSVFAKPLR